MDCIDRNKVNDYLKRHLKSSRYTHSLGVVTMAVRIGENLPVDEAFTERLRLAALCHDIAKCETPESMNRLIRTYGLEEKYLYLPQLAHSKVGAAMLKTDFHIDDEELLRAVAYHTTGRAGMSLMEKIIYVSDAIEPNRTYPDRKAYERLALRDLDLCCYAVLDFTIKDVASKGRKQDPDALAAYEEYKARFGNLDFRALLHEHTE